MNPRNLSTVSDILQLILEHGHPRAMLYRRGQEWLPLCAAEIYRAAAAVARTLGAWGLEKGERVAILGENRPEWAIADFACLCSGLVDVPIYPTLTPEQTAFMLADSGARVVFCSTREQVHKVASILPHTAVERIVAMDEAPMIEAVPMHTIMHGEHNHPAPGKIELDPAFEARRAQIVADDAATIIYTSGTTGTPKGAVLTHGNLASNLVHSLEVFGLRPDDVSISCLPLSHITARHADYAMFQYGVSVAYCPDIVQLPQVLLEVKPTFFVAVPRLYEKVRTEVERQTKSPLKRRVLQWALRAGRGHIDEVAAGRVPGSTRWRIAHRLVFSKIAAGFGGRVRIFISGGAPLGRDLAAWYAGVGIRIFEGYGLTETSPVIALNTPAAYRLGTVGKPLPNLECRIAGDGELEVRGPSVFKAYWNKPEETRSAFTADGWFKTGDIAALDADGFLSIVDRKKDLLKTSGGKFIAPQPIEGALKANVLVAHAVVIGDRRKFPAVVIAPHFPMLEDWAQANQVASVTREDLVSSPKVHALYEGIVQDVNSRLARYEKVKRFLLVADEFSVAGGELTPTLKLKRRVVEEKYRSQIDALYREAERQTEAVAR